MLFRSRIYTPTDKLSRVMVSDCRNVELVRRLWRETTKVYSDCSLCDYVPVDDLHLPNRGGTISRLDNFQDCIRGVLARRDGYNWFGRVRLLFA